MIDTPAFVSIDLFNGTNIKGRAVRFSDPTAAILGGAFVMEEREGVKNYVLWAAILRVTVFPLDAAPQQDDVTVEKPEEAA